MTTPEQRAVWAALAAVATPGEWTEVAESGEWWVSTTSDETAALYVIPDTALMNQADVDFVCAARAAVPALLADVDALTQERDALLWESDDGICGHCGEGAIRVSIDTQGYPYEVFAVRYCPVCHNAWVREEPVNPDASQM